MWAVSSAEKSRTWYGEIIDNKVQEMSKMTPKLPKAAAIYSVLFRK